MAIIDSIDNKSAMDILRSLDHQFYLGGSRRAAQLQQAQAGRSPVVQFKIDIGDHTDFDFYATYSNDLLSQLLANGFKECKWVANNPRLSYMDDEAITVVEMDAVQVVLRKDALFYRRVFDNIPSEFFYRYLWKSSPLQPDRAHIRLIMNTLFAVARSTEGELSVL